VLHRAHAAASPASRFPLACDGDAAATGGIPSAAGPTREFPYRIHGARSGGDQRSRRRAPCGKAPPTCIGGCGFCAKMEAEWTPQMTEVLGVDATSLPIIQDADFLYAYGV
jgi:hypothetical protein